MSAKFSRGFGAGSILADSLYDVDFAKGIFQYLFGIQLVFYASQELEINKNAENDIFPLSI